MNILAEILSSKVRAEFFRLLFGIRDYEYHLREIERQSGFTIGTVRQEAEKLLRNALVIKRIDGNRTYYSANKEHPLYPEIHSLTLKTVGLRDILLAKLQSADIRFAFVFGSIASGSTRADSDIDLFVIGNTSLRELSGLLGDASDLLGREINIQVMKFQDYSQKLAANEHFITSVMSSPKLMIIGAEGELTNLV
ncbi:MAG: nucleotidyltransferase domain-containing protein [Candidatus Marinimicrobia bacterium]|nr:nucleotidyltransferase domain-containing protein [Candidatus Neomarinimicrobiota bacterium]